ncbi:MAG: glutamyl-tRNA reductase [Gammaproteobacteria bacterium]|nr:glutamyl-tRNA reductase [Gammaproteobacteria bacterium]
MPLVALGLNHKTAPIDLREQVTFGPEQLLDALKGLAGVPEVNEVAILSTCNRTEIYYNVDSESDDVALQWFLNKHGLEASNHSQFLYRHLDEHTVRHLFRVACGLDSMVLGEPQILGQLKTAYQAAETAGTVGLQLSHLFQFAFSVAKEVRTRTDIGANPVSIAFAAVRLAQRIFSDLENRTALLVGAGEMIELAARHLKGQGIGHIIIANRTIERARPLAREFEGEAVALTELANNLHRADIVISCTASPIPVIGKGTVERALKKRKHQPMLMIDIAVPRDIEPEVEKLNDVYLYSVDDMESVIEENRRSREQAAEQAEAIITLKVAEFMAWQRSLDAVNTIRKYRAAATDMSNDVLDKAKKMLATGKTPEEALQFLAHTLTNKLLHTPTIKLNQAAREGREQLLSAASELFELDNHNPKK